MSHPQLEIKFAKEHLKYEILKQYGKVNELTIDSSWPLNNELDGDEYALWKRLVAEAGKVKQGLQVINVCDINLFKQCWYLIQLVKQEKLDFHGYVLIVTKDMDWEKDVKKFIEAQENDNRFELKLMMQDWYRLI